MSSQPEAGEDRQAWRAIFKREATGEYLFHSTPLSTAIEHILPTAQLRFSRFSAMRDPRETDWAFAASFFGDIPEADRRYWELRAAVDELKDSVRILALTPDVDEARWSHQDDFGRGFAHPRLWEHYANNHLGVCLCLNRETLIEAASRAVASIGGTLIHRPVAYRDGEIALEASHLDLHAVYERGADAVASEHFKAHEEELLFTKLREVEYRLLTLWEAADELFVDVSEALEALVVGHAVGRECAQPALALRERWCCMRAVAVAERTTHGLRVHATPTAKEWLTDHSSQTPGCNSRGGL